MHLSPFATAVLLVGAPALLAGQASATRSALSPGQRIYAAHAELGGQRQDLGLRTVTLDSLDPDGRPAWLLVVSWELDGSHLVDSVLMSRPGLLPLSRHATAQGSWLMVRVRRDCSNVFMGDDSTLVPLVVPLNGASYLNDFALRLYLGSAPLSSEWTGHVSVLEVAAHSEYVPVTLRVIGTEQIVSKAGTYDCWIIQVTGRGIDERYWLAKGSQEVIRTRAPLDEHGAILQLDLDSLSLTN